jgi:hypothetical protein
MTQPKMIDRSDELDFFLRLARREVGRRLLLVRAASGWGKSDLLRLFKARCPPETPCLLFDLRAPGLNIEEILRRISRALGRERFPKTQIELDAARSAIQLAVNKNILLGVGNRIEINQAPEGEAQRHQQTSRLAEALFDDLTALGRLVLIFDTLNLCQDAELRAWLEGPFLARLQYAPELVVVLAGQVMPEPTSDWEDLAHFMELGGIPVSHWRQYAQETGMQVSEKLIDGIWVVTRGHPIQTLASLETAVREGWG